MSTTNTAGTATRPEETETLLVEAVNTRDLDAAVALFEPDAALVIPSGDVVTGSEAIRGAVGRMLAMEPRATTQVTQVIRQDGVALVHADWTLSGTTPDGSDYERRGTNAAVVRRRADGSWGILIQNRPGPPTG